ncbi:MAG: ATP-binding protein [Anaerolineae bacterium]
MSGNRLERVASFLLKDATRAIGEFALIDDGDRVAVAVSGGKDSRALLELLLRHRRRVPYDYDLLAIHVDGTEAGLPDVRTDLEPWLDGLNVDHHVVPLALPPEEPLPLTCFRCSWNRRKALFIAASELGCGKLALGHHADDAAVTTLMNLLFNGELRTMEPRVAFFDDTVTVIRPLIYVAEKELLRLAQAAGYPGRPSCPRETQSRRAQVQTFLRQLGPEQDQVRTNLWRITKRTQEG